MTIYRIFRSRHTAVQASLALLGAACAQISVAQTTMGPNAEAATASAANPAVQVPPVSYRSVFKETSLGVEKDTEEWRKANDEVGKFLRGHVDILKWEEQENAKAMKEPMTQPIAEPSPAGAIAPKPAATKPVAPPVHQH
jgi:hypothetical protein